MSPRVTPATARSLEPVAESTCRSMLSDRWKQRSTGAAIRVTSSIVAMAAV
jgi:hypothetical protein